MFDPEVRRLLGEMASAEASGQRAEGFPWMHMRAMAVAIRAIEERLDYLDPDTSDE